MMILLLRIVVMVLCTIFISNVDTKHPENKEEYANGFWFGTQLISCMAGKIGSGTSFLSISKRSLNSSPPPPPPPSRLILRYIHRLLFYRGRVIEWGTGVRGYFIGSEASVVDCPVTWENSPAGQSMCPVQVVEKFTRAYRSKYGPYHLLTNNCHHFTNRVSALLMGCGRIHSGQERDDSMVSTGVRYLWSFVDAILSKIWPTEDDKTARKTKNDQIVIIE